MQLWLKAHKKPVIIAAAILFLLIASWQTFSTQLAKAFQNSLLEKVNQQLNGKFQAGTVDVSLLGWIQLHNVVLYNQQGELLMQSPLIKIGYRWSDLAGRSFGLQQIETVALENAELWLKDKDSRLNWEGLLKNETAASSDFHGKIELIKSKMNIETSLLVKNAEAINGYIDYAKTPDILINLAGRIEQSPFSIGGQWGQGRDGELMFSAEKLDLIKLGLLLGSDLPTRLESGVLEKVKLTFAIKAQGGVKLGAQGEFSNLATSGSLRIENGRGSFSGDDTGLEFKNLSLAIAGQQAQGQGKIAWQNGAGLIDFTLDLPDLDPASLIAGLTVQRPLSAQIQAVGPTAAPVITGTFRAAQVSFSDMAVAGVSGRFRYENNYIALEQADGAAHNGRLAAAGQVQVSAQSYELDVEGEGMDSSRLTDKDVQGPLSFSGHTSGQGQNAVTRGNFIIHGGKAYGVPFDRMTGTFVKRDTATDISDLAVQTALGTFYPEQLSQEALERIKNKDIPVTRKELEKEITNKLIQRIFR
jgi:hypothetical protein